MKVIVKNNFLNVRVGKPSVNAPCYQYIAPGSEIEVDGQLYKGDKYENIDTWFKDEAGNYYWSGGINNLIERSSSLDLDFQRLIDSALDGQRLISGIDYNALLELDNSLKSGGGENVIIGILDHPISTSINLSNNIIRPFHIADPLFNFHANFISGIIAGTRGIAGISGKVKIMELPIFNERGSSSGIDIDRVIKFVNDFDQPMILNISVSMDSRFNESIKNLRKDVIVVASAGIDERLSSENKLFHPSTQENVIAVGAVNKISARPVISNKVDFILPNFNYISYGKNMDLFASEKGDSFSCAVVSSIIALLISSGKASYNIGTIKKQLINISQPYSTSSLDSFHLINSKA